jgi:hypothetical protein
MALIQIACPKCGHSGFTGTLPRMLRCCICAHVALFRAGERVIRGEPEPEPEPEPMPKRPQKRTLVPGEQRHRRKAANVAA